MLDSFLLEHEAEKRPKFKNMLRTYPRLRKGKELLFWILHKVTAIIVSRLNVRHCNIIYSVVLLNIFFINCYLSFLCVYASGWLCECKITTAHPIPTILFQNILRIFEAEALKYLRTFNLSPKIRLSYSKKYYVLPFHTIAYISA